MSTGSPNQVRLIDIARKAGVSKITVAKVLHDTGGKNTRVSEATAGRVRKIAAKLNYRPNLAARQLAGQKSKIIGGIIDSLAPETVIKELSSIERMAADHGYRLMVGYSHGEFERISNYVNDFLGRGVDGVICLSHTYPEYGNKVAELFKPFKHCVFVEPPIGDVPFPFVTSDYAAAGYLVTQHLLSLGYRRIAIIQDGSRNQSVMQEFSGYLQAMKEANIVADRSLIWQTDEPLESNLPNMHRCLKDLLPGKPQGIIVGNDGRALWLIRALAELGMKVPEDMAVVSTDRWEIGSACLPSITSVDLRPGDVARQAANILMEELENPKDFENKRSSSRSLVLPPQLVIGESCGAKSPKIQARQGESISFHNLDVNLSRSTKYGDK